MVNERKTGDKTVRSTRGR